MLTTRESEDSRAVILAGDSVRHRALVGQRLEQAGYTVVLTDHGDACLRVLADARPDILLLDLTTPDRDGWNTLERIREHSSVPVIVLTPTSETVRALRAGADDCITKPFSQDELEARIDARLRRSRTSRRDSLTGLLNRRAFDEHLNAVVSRASAESEPSSLLLFDLDGFKEINDRDGHPAGDRILQTIALVTRRQTRASEAIFRLGGDEFGIVIAGDADVASLVAARLLGAVADESRHGPLVTLSIGIATHPTDAFHAVELMQAADAALYSSKHTGRNMVTLAATRRAA